jgi:hypothetical protein
MARPQQPSLCFASQWIALGEALGLAAIARAASAATSSPAAAGRLTVVGARGHIGLGSAPRAAHAICWATGLGVGCGGIIPQHSGWQPARHAARRRHQALGGNRSTMRSFGWAVLGSAVDLAAS